MRDGGVRYRALGTREASWVEALAMAVVITVAFQTAYGAFLPRVGPDGARGRVEAEEGGAAESQGASAHIAALEESPPQGGAETGAAWIEADLSAYGLSPCSEPPSRVEQARPRGSMFYDEARGRYKDGDLRISIPLIGLDAPVYGGTDKESLGKGPGLLAFSPLPGEGDRNVSIAGHRNGIKNGKITKIMFFDLDKLGQGDYIYLYGNGKVFRYRFESTEIVSDDDWSPMASRGYSCVTLATCEPVGVADHRLIVRGALEGVYQPAAGETPEGGRLPASAAADISR